LTIAMISFIPSLPLGSWWNGSAPEWRTEPEETLERYDPAALEGRRKNRRWTSIAQKTGVLVQGLI